MLNLAVTLEHTARHCPDRPAVIAGPVRMTYADLDAAATQFAVDLVERGLEPGDRVALSCPNTAWFPVAHFGILKAGLTCVPLNTLLGEREVVQHLQDSDARAYVCHDDIDGLPIGQVGRAAFANVPGCAELVTLPADDAASTFARAPVTSRRDTAPRAESDTAVVLYTSGTTGRPKGAELSHSNLVHNALLAQRLYGLVSDDVHLVAVPLFHTFGLTLHLHGGFAAGASLVMMPRFHPTEALTAMRREEVTLVAGVPTMYSALVQHAASEPGSLAGAAKRLRVGVAGAAPLSPELSASFERTFGAPILEGYGLSETSPIAASNRIDLPRRAGSVGPAAWGVELRIVRGDGTSAEAEEAGEILIRGHNVMTGYLGRPEATAEAIDGHGWFHSGDIGRLDAHGYLTILDRSKDVIIRGGFNVYPREIEEVLLDHPDVSLAAVVGVPHERHGEEVKAFVVRRAGSTLDEEELIAWCRSTMARYKYPRFVEFRRELPLSATGKVLKRELAAGK